MRIITVRRIRQFLEQLVGREKKQAQREFGLLIAVIEAASWSSLADLKNTFGHRVDFVKTKRSKNTVSVIDVCNNHYRMIVHIHFLEKHAEKGRVYVLRILRHSEYDDKHWMEEV